jgi:hypothetical protein
MVVVEGKLVGPMISNPEATPPWNYELFRSNQTIETISKKGTVSIGILWNFQDDYSFENTRVVGVVREGHWLSYLYGEPPACYYIEAKRIDRL